MKSISMIEFRSIARGIETTDTMIKTANISVLRSATICPGKYIVLVGGSTGAVEEALKVGLMQGSPYVVSHSIIPNVDPQVIAGIEGFTHPQIGTSVGILEYYAVIDAIIGSDLAVKAANVDIIELRLGFAIGGKGYVVLTGDTAEIDYAVQCAKESAKETGMLLETSVINNISPELLKFLV